MNDSIVGTKEHYADWEFGVMYSGWYQLQREFNHTNIQFGVNKDNGCIKIWLNVSDKDGYIRADQVKFSDKFYQEVRDILQKEVSEEATFYIQDQTITISGKFEYYRKHFGVNKIN